ncbi:hypothetical protein VOLCADRAFT_88104 [Volvox carteri f. nagariensis]|uniref:Uncharacterized protein mot15 n=1 Tax=Volvox carteri f. nagariensis TaxID=3068 RepID=D8TN33_VOLCA|nr:uncharacterized protein VOLCADRAFT_88104 [Volvox carteri f. nagariensis]EFJ51234.1 hypothetical protein VOLCADRAFT_88104 [Volvox carteri f. nagariensis]|eukprot:XP_002947701.1 hypothetical protein VOLCADRAFT_88104 [Volvox carteri f. nagariensis]
MAKSSRTQEQEKEDSCISCCCFAKYIFAPFILLFMAFKIYVLGMIAAYIERLGRGVFCGLCVCCSCTYKDRNFPHDHRSIGILKGKSGVELDKQVFPCNASIGTSASMTGQTVDVLHRWESAGVKPCSLSSVLRGFLAAARVSEPDENSSVFWLTPRAPHWGHLLDGYTPGERQAGRSIRLQIQGHRTTFRRYDKHRAWNPLCCGKFNLEQERIKEGQDSQTLIMPHHEHLGGRGAEGRGPGRIKQDQADPPSGSRVACQIAELGALHLCIFDPAADGRPLFAKPQGDEAWVMLLEKAMAKFMGKDYASLDGNLMIKALEVLTGDFVCLFRLGDVRDAKSRGKQRHQQLWTRLELSRGPPPKDAAPGDDLRLVYAQDEPFNHDLMFRSIKWELRHGSTIGASNAGGRDTQSIHGIVQGHAYSIIRAEEADDKRFLRLRNPWGTFEWTGSWSDKSPLWERNPKVKSALDFNPTSDGSFWQAGSAGWLGGAGGSLSMSSGSARGWCGFSVVVLHTIGWSGRTLSTTSTPLRSTGFDHVVIDIHEVLVLLPGLQGAVLRPQDPVVCLRELVGDPGPGLWTLTLASHPGPDGPWPAWNTASMGSAPRCAPQWTVCLTPLELAP